MAAGLEAITSQVGAIAEKGDALEAVAVCVAAIDVICETGLEVAVAEVVGCEDELLDDLGNPGISVGIVDGMSHLVSEDGGPWL